MSQGILYVATGEQYIREAYNSAETVVQHLDSPIAIVSDQDISGDLFDTTIVLDNPKYSSADKIRGLMLSPFEETIYMDTDTHLLSDISELFDCLTHFDIAAAHSPHEWTTRILENTIEEVPEPVPEYNTGVLPFRNNQRINGFFDYWKSYYAKTSPKDQPAFRAAITMSDVRFISLPRIYNYIYQHPAQFTGEVKTLHDVDRFLDYEHSRGELGGIGDRINITQNPRINYHLGDQVVSPDTRVHNIIRIILLIKRML